MPGKTIALNLLYKWSHEVVTKKLICEMKVLLNSFHLTGHT